MPYDLHIEIGDGYVFFKRSGVANASEVAESWKQVAETCNTLGIKKILAETHNESYLSAAELYKIASRFRDLGFDPYFKVAHVFTGTEPKRFEGFGETVGKNRGANYKVFGDIEHAKKWLLETRE